MLLTVFCAPRDRPESTFSLDVSPELELRDFLALCELEAGVPAGEIQISFAEQPLKDLSRTLGAYGLKDGDVLVLRQADRLPPPAQPSFPGLPRIDFSTIAVPGTSAGQQSTARPQQQQQPAQPSTSSPRSSQPAASPSTGQATSPQGLDDPSLLREMLLANPHELSLLKERNPPLAEALLSGDLERFSKVLLEQQQDRARREQERIRLLTADPFDLEAQAKIEEDIRQHNIEENMTIAMEEAPESFGQVVMLYINCKVNGHPVKAFVDSGAQMTIMSQACAERCNIMRLVDRRWAGIAKGVGTQKIIGRVHLAQVQIEGDFLPCSFSILEDQPMDMLLGLDMLKRHQCSIDLKKSVLLIGTTGSETRFLPEAELPECARLAYGPEGRDEARPEEIADQELAEALQRSVQDSDTEDGQTTSPHSLPKPIYLPFSNTAVSSSSPGPPSSSSHNRNPGSCKTEIAPDGLQSLAEPFGQPPASQAEDPGFASLETEDDVPFAVEDEHVSGSEDMDSGTLEKRNQSTAQVAADVEGCAFTDKREPGLSPSELMESSSSVSVGEDGADRPVPADPHTTAMTSDNSNQEMDLSEATGATPVQPEEVDWEEKDGSSISNMPSLGLAPVSSCLATPSPSDGSVSEETMEGPAVPERDQPEGDGSNSVPSLAQALRELHELLVSNSRAMSPDKTLLSPAARQDADGVDRRRSEVPLTATVPALDVSVAKVKHAPLQEQEPPETGTSLHRARPNEDADWNDDPSLKDVCENGRAQVPELQDESVPQEGLKVREPPEGQQGRGVADGRASGMDVPDVPHSPLSMAVGSSSDEPDPRLPASNFDDAAAPPAEAPPLAPPPPQRPPPEQFPVERIRRVQEAGFSAQEAAEALEKAQGCVELAILVLLARKITVPTQTL